MIIEEKEELLAAKLADRLKKENINAVANGTVLKVQDYTFVLQSSNEQPIHCGVRYEMPSGYGEETLYSY
ncbi:hypothetical protein, partial [Ruminococcus albus]